jgi:hypothetical protein
MTGGTQLERLRALEVEMHHARADLAEIRKTQIEIRDTLINARAWALMVKYLYPPASAVALWVAAQLGYLPLPR